MSGVHVMIRGRQEDLSFEELFPVERHEALGIPSGTAVLPSTVTEVQIRMALAQKYDVGIGEFSESFIEINPNGNITVRPNTPFGRSV
jgi:hypothetical protein